MFGFKWNMVFEQIKIISLLILSSLTIQAQGTCMKIFEDRIKEAPPGSVFYTLKAVPEKDIITIIYICDFLRENSEGGLFVNNTCENGHWKYQLAEIPRCNYKKFCPRYFESQDKDKCVYFGPAENYKQSKEICSKYGARLPMYKSDYEWNHNRWYKDYVNKSNKNEINFAWIGLERIDDKWQWADGTAFTLESHWAISSPSYKFKYDFGMILTDKGELSNLQDDYKTQNLENQHDLQFRGYMMCEMKKDKALAQSITGVSRLAFYNFGEPISINITGLTDLIAFYDLKEPKLYPPSELEEKQQKEDKDDEPTVKELFQTIRESLKPAFVGLEQQGGVFCEKMKGRTVKFSKNQQLKRVENISDAKCEMVEEDGEQILRLTISNEATDEMIGKYAVVEPTLGLTEIIYIEVVDDAGWSHWSRWSDCSVDKPPRKTRTRKCAKFYQPEKFSHGDCNKVMEQNIKDCKRYELKKDHPYFFLYNDASTSSRPSTLWTLLMGFLTSLLSWNINRFME